MTMLSLEQSQSQPAFGDILKRIPKALDDDH